MQFLIPGSFHFNILLELNNVYLHDLIIRAFLLFEDVQSNYYFFIKWMKHQYRPRSENIRGTNGVKLHSLYRIFQRKLNQVFQPSTYPFLIFEPEEYFDKMKASLTNKAESFMINRTSFIERYVDSKGSLIKYELEEKMPKYKKSFGTVFDPHSLENVALIGKGKKRFISAVEIYLERMSQETENPDL